MDKAGLRPFEILMQYKYLRDRNILIINNTSRIPEIRNYSELVKCIPPSVDELISRRWRQINKDIPKDEWIEFSNKTNIYFQPKSDAIGYSYSLFIVNSFLIKYGCIY